MDGDWEGYEQSLGRSVRSDLRRCRRRLEELGRVALDVEHDTAHLDEALAVRRFRRAMAFPGDGRGVTSAIAGSSSRTTPHYSEDGRDRVAPDLGSVARVPGRHSEQTFSVAARPVIEQ